MKLRNKKTGEIVEWFNNTDGIFPNSLAELNEEWEDYTEEPKDFWFIDPETLIACESTNPLLCDKKVAIETMKQIGNYFETKEEAEKAVEKLEALEKLNNARMSFKDYHYELKEDDALITYELRIEADGFAYEDFTDDLDLLFGGKK